MGKLPGRHRAGRADGSPADIAAVRKYQSRGGISMNLEQQLTPNVGFFARAGIADGDKEPYNSPTSTAPSPPASPYQASSRGRDDDTVGIAGVVNGISGVHQAYLNARPRNPGRRRSAAQSGQREDHRDLLQFPGLFTKFTLDYQLIVNPAYNRDRGPASVLGLRVHSQY